MPFRFFADTPMISVSPFLRALVSHRYSNKHHHHLTSSFVYIVFVSLRCILIHYHHPTFSLGRTPLPCALRSSATSAPVGQASVIKQQNDAHLGLGLGHSRGISIESNVLSNLLPMVTINIIIMQHRIEVQSRPRSNTTRGRRGDVGSLFLESPCVPHHKC